MTTDETLVKPKVKIKVFGVGGGGNSVLMRMGQHNELDIELYAVNTDAKQLQITAQVGGVNCIQIGENLTRGRGTGGNIQIGEQAAKNDAAKLQAAMNGADLVFVTAGMGGGTGTGAAPIVARLAKEMGILSVGVVTVPFAFEGNRKKKVAQEGITKMQSQMDALIAVENDNLSKLPENRKMSLVKAFECADNILKQAINCVAELILTTGVINVDFADVTTIFRQSESSDALLGIGVSERSAVDAVKIAAESPLIDKGLTGARGIILNLTGDSTLSLYDVDEATRYIVKHTDPEVNIILGTVEDNTMKGAVQATIIATDFADSVVMKAPTVKVPESAIKKETLQKETFQMEVPAFMNKDKKEEKPSQPFAIPAFKLTDLPDKDKQ
ncbi:MULTISPECIES: cell division protein FtsZ [Selenomonas]|uniref:Cell division protein FtsZ n=1 Tax=Selenomonas ruminantium TaxID=971 RepID=A0A1H4AE98_SELRU|nr:MULTISPECIES: cell division protein FtsZ [Selenomonas]MBR1693988.1 cell division protein FtsZ [Selenomonas sp.]SEA34078.1 cell division protein FtsZ [Selenomonas ruminantium]SFB14725.1 cell division protein FtsZ [Selenomonas ruminantium]